MSNAQGGTRIVIMKREKNVPAGTVGTALVGAMRYDRVGSVWIHMWTGISNTMNAPD